MLPPPVAPVALNEYAHITLGVLGAMGGKLCYLCRPSGDSALCCKPCSMEVRYLSEKYHSNQIFRQTNMKLKKRSVMFLCQHLSEHAAPT
ncbi:hypothetical protein FRX31_015799, partial [Thalictrum thalictroides]